MRVLLTRPLADSLVTAKILNNENIATAIEPLFEITQRDFTLPELSDFHALIFTSRHAVKAFAGKSEYTSIDVYCVGDRTAETARKNGFSNVVSANGDEDDLVKLVTEKIDKSQKLLRLTGYMPDELSTQLQNASYDVTALQIYDVQDKKDLSPETIELLKQGKLDGVAFFSPQTAYRFYTLLDKYGLAETCRTMIAWCISDNAAKALGGANFKSVKIAKRPSRQALLELIFKERTMFTDEDLPPLPKFNVKKWALSGMIAWSLFFGAVGGLGVLLLADYGPEKINPMRELKENVATVDNRISLLEKRTQKLNEQQATMQMPPAQTMEQNSDSQVTKILVGLTQLKTSYDNEAPLTDGITTLKSTIKNSGIQEDLAELQRLTSDNLPSKEKILDDLHNLQTPSNQNLKNEQGEQSLNWRDRAKMALSQLVRVTPTKNIVSDKDIDRVQQAVASGDYNLAKKFAAHLPDSPSAQVVMSEIRLRSDAQDMVQKIVTQISSAIGASGQGNLY
jgi:uroporphyrinogen-III synthase